MLEAPKCASCNGWGIELGKATLDRCHACGGSGRPPRQQQTEQKQEGGLLDGR
jgi:DnaJ-class molecular chaperone